MHASGKTEAEAASSQVILTRHVDGGGEKLWTGSDPTDWHKDFNLRKKKEEDKCARQKKGFWRSGTMETVEEV